MRFLALVLFFMEIFFSQEWFSCVKNKNPVETWSRTVPGKHLVYVQNYSAIMWIGTNSDSIGGLMQSLVGSGQGYWIGGRVVPQQAQPYHFYFDPSTVLIAEFTAEGMQATIQQISRDPVYFASHGWSNGLAEHAWYVRGYFLEYRRGR